MASVPFNRNRACTIHAICALLHLASTVIIAVYALEGTSLSAYNNYVNSDTMLEFTTWVIYCYEKTDGSYTKFNSSNTSAAYCPDDTKLYFVQQGNKTFKTPVNILGLALSFTTVSACVHLLSAILCKLYPTKYTLEIDSMLRFTLDYAISAPVMLALINIVFGANSYGGVILAPILLSVSLVLAGLLLNTAVQNANNGRQKWYAACFVMLCGVYVVTVLPTIIAVAKAATLAPTGVIIFMCGFLVAFSSFIVPYVLELRQQMYGYFVAYAALSLNAKAILHSFLAISVLQQAKLYKNSLVNLTATNQTPPIDMTEQNGQAFAIIFGAPAVGLLLYIFLKYYCDPLASNQALRLIDLKEIRKGTGEHLLNSLVL